MVDTDVDQRPPLVIPDWVLLDWPESAEPSGCSDGDAPDPSPGPPPESLWEWGLEPASQPMPGAELSPVPESEFEPVPESVPEAVPSPVGWAIPGVTWDADPSPSTAVPPSPVVRVLQAAAEVVCRVDPVGLSPAQAIADAEALQTISQQLRVHSLQRLADMTARELHGLRGFRSTTAWLRDVQPDADSADAGLARKLPGYRLVASAVEGGGVSLTAARQVLTALGRCQRHLDRPDGRIDDQPGEQVIPAVVGHVIDLVAGCVLGMTDDDPRLAELQAAVAAILATGPQQPGDTTSPSGTAAVAGAVASQAERLEAAFVLLAQHVPAMLLRPCLEELVLAVVPSILDDRAERGRDRAGLSLERTPDGSGWHLDADLDLQTGERLFTALRAEIRRDPQNPHDTDTAAQRRAQGLDPYNPDTKPTSGKPTAADRLAAGTGTNDDPAGDTADLSTGWPRSRRERMHDAFDALLGRYLEHGLGGSSQKTPVQISVTISSALIDHQPGARPAVADSGTPIPRATVQRWWCDSRVTAFVLSRGGQALRAIHLGRTLTAVERRAAHLEHGGRCAGIGCCRSGTDPTSDLRPHHVRRYADDGTTSLSDSILACDTLHHDIHEGGKRIKLRNGRHLTEQGWTD